MSRSKIFIIALCIFSGYFLKAQNVVPDTVYVYEEVIVYDTVYIEKPIEKLNLEKAILTFDTKTNKSVLQIINNGKPSSIPIQQTIIDNDTLENIVKKILKKKKNIWDYGLKIEFLTLKNTIFSDKLTTGLGAGFFVKRSIVHPKLFAGAAISYVQNFENVNLKPNETNADFSGFYFFNSEPKLISELSNKHSQINFSSQLSWKIKKFSPSFGGFYALNNYKATFISSSGNSPVLFDTEEVLKTKLYQIGYFIELNYEYNKRWEIALKYFTSKINSLTFVDNNTKLSVDTNGQESGIGIQLFFKF